jgi:hypothetical protein
MVCGISSAKILVHPGDARSCHKIGIKRDVLDICGGQQLATLANRSWGIFDTIDIALPDGLPWSWEVFSAASS